MSTPKRLFASLLLSLLFVVPLASASNTILPNLEENLLNESGVPCDPKHENWGSFWEPIFQDEVKLKEQIDNDEDGRSTSNILACAIKTGRVQFWMVPYFISNILNFLIGISGLLSVLMIIVGAYFYIAGGLTDDKEKGKTIITYALGGLVLTILSWTIVNFVLLIITS